MLGAYAGLVGLVCLGMSVYSLKRPGVAWAMFGLMYATEQLLQSQFAFFTANRSVANLFFAATVLLSLVANTPPQVFRRILQNSPQMLAIIFFLLVIAATGWCFDSEVAKKNLLQSSPYLFFTIILAPLCLRDEENLKYGIATFLILGVLVCIGLLFTTVDTSQKRWIVMKDSQLLGNPLEIGSCGGRVAIISLILTLELRTKWRIVLLAVACLGMAVAVKSGSRGQVLGALLAIGSTMLLETNGKLSPRIIFASIGLTTLLALGYFFLSAFDMIDRFNWANLQSDYEGGRIDPLTKVLGVYWESNFATHMAGIGTESSYSIVGTYPHVVFGQVLAEQGLLGAFLFCAMHAIAAIQCKRKIDLTDGSQKLLRGGYVCLLGLMIFDIILGFKQGGTLGASLYFIPMSIGHACATGTTRYVGERKLHYAGSEIVANGKVSLSQ